MISGKKNLVDLMEELFPNTQMFDHTAKEIALASEISESSSLYEKALHTILQEMFQLPQSMAELEALVKEEVHSVQYHQTQIMLQGFEQWIEKQKGE